MSDGIDFQTAGDGIDFQESDKPSQIGSFVRGAANNFPLAPQAIAGAESLTGIGDEGGYSKNLSDWNSKAAAAKKANPISYGAGAVGGAVAPLLIPGVGEALEASPILGNAAYGAANALSNEDLSKDPENILKKGGVGALIGGSVGAAGEAVSGLASKVGQKLEPAARNIEAQTTAHAIDINPRSLYKMAQSSGKNPEQVALDINEKMQDLFPDMIKLNDTGASKYDKFLNAHNQASDTIGKVIDATDENLKGYSNFKYGKFKELNNPVMPEVDSAVNKLQAASNKYKGLSFEDSVQSKAILDDTKKKIQDLAAEGKLNFQNLSLLKQEIGQIYHNPNNVVRGVDQAYGIMSDSMNNILDRVSIAEPSLKPAYDHAKEVFKFTSDILPAMGRGVSREVAGSKGGLTNSMLGAGAIFGHPLAAGVGYGAKTLAHMAAPELGENVGYKLMNAAKNGNIPFGKIGQGASQELIDFLESKFGKK